MKRRQWTLAAVAAFGAATLIAPVGASAAPTPAGPPSGEAAPSARQQDDRPSPKSDKQRELQRKAGDLVAQGKAKITTNKKGKRVVEVAKGQYVNYDVNREEAVFTILSEFGDKTMEPQGGTPGPVHNKIPQPDRTQNNSTVWSPDFNTDYYKNLMFGATNSFKDFYLKQSLGRFLAKGDVSDWVKVPYNEARYGHNSVEGDGTDEAEGYWAFVKDSVNAWYDAQKAAGKSEAQIKEYLKQFDHVDRYDHDGDGDFNEPDGYVDHIQIIHAGEGEDAGGGAEGEDAIWSHRWYAFGNDAGETGPANNLAGGTQVGNSGLWVGDYTTEPENGGLGVFVHEFGHDLGLPDFYDTQGGDNGTGFWTLMSAGSWLNKGTDAIGDRAGYMGPKEKIQLGWADVQNIAYGQDTTLTLGPADRDGKHYPQVIAVNLPEKPVTFTYNKPHAGAMEWWSGSDDNLSNTLSRTIDLTKASSASVSAWVDLQTEAGYDVLSAQVSTDGVRWESLEDMSGTKAWAQHTWDLSAYAGKSVTFRFLYKTDGGLSKPGAFLDDLVITVDGKAVLTDDAETGDNGWAAKGFTRMGGSESKKFAQYYLAENRVYSGYDQYLRTGPYNFGWADTRPDWVERFPYQNGMLVWFSDTSQKDNNTKAHPGYGQALVVDARPKAIVFPDGVKLGNRRQPFDATFGLERTDAVTFHRLGKAVTVPSSAAIPTFDDSNVNAYWDATNPWHSAKVAGSGTQISVLSDSKQGDAMRVQVRFTK